MEKQYCPDGSTQMEKRSIYCQDDDNLDTISSYFQYLQRNIYTMTKESNSIKFKRVRKPNFKVLVNKVSMWRCNTEGQ